MELYCHYTNSKKEEYSKIILLHGMGGTGALWRPIVASLEDHYTLLTPDQRGHGRSRLEQRKSVAPSGDHAFGEVPDSATYTPLNFGQDLTETMDALKFHPVWLVGHSMGVRTALACAHLKPDWVLGLVLVDLSLSPPIKQQDIHHKTKTPLQNQTTDEFHHSPSTQKLIDFLCHLPAQFNSRAEARDYLLKHSPDPSFAQYLMAVSLKTSTTEITFPFDPQDLVKIVESAHHALLFQWAQKFASLQKPILILRGQQSAVYTHADFQAEKEALAPYPTILFEEVEGAGHGLPFEKRAEFVERLIQFVEENTVQRASS